MTKAFAVCVGFLAIAGLLAVSPLHASASSGTAILEIQAALDKGDAQQAANLADTALKENGVGANARGGLLLYRGLARELLGAHAEAMADFTAALQVRALPPDEREQALLQRGFLLDGLGRLDAAAADYTAVIALKGASASTALNNRANIYRRQGKLTQAQRDYRLALEHANGKPQYSWYGLGQIAETQGDSGAARSFYAKAVAADPAYALASQRLAVLGPPATAMADPGVITLRPPAPVSAVRANPAPAEATPIVLRPPTPPKDPDRIVLRPPQSRRAALRLRPALDGVRPAAAAAQVQLGAWRSEAEARDGWKKAIRRAGGALDSLTPSVVVADLPGRGRYYRLRTSPLAGGSAARLCAALTAQGLDCIPARD